MDLTRDWTPINNDRQINRDLKIENIFTEIDFINEWFKEVEVDKKEQPWATMNEHWVF